MEIKNYKPGTLFLSATKNIKSPLKVTALKKAEHVDRLNRISQLERLMVIVWNENNPPKENYNQIKEQFFIENCNKLWSERNYLLSLPKDIINSSGGVIYCGETNTWAEIVKK